jgi:hypothetical protein
MCGSDADVASISTAEKTISFLEYARAPVW